MNFVHLVLSQAQSLRSFVLLSTDFFQVEVFGFGIRCFFSSLLRAMFTLKQISGELFLNTVRRHVTVQLDLTLHAKDGIV